MMKFLFGLISHTHFPTTLLAFTLMSISSKSPLPVTVISEMFCGIIIFSMSLHAASSGLTTSDTPSLRNILIWDGSVVRAIIFFKLYFWAVIPINRLISSTLVAATIMSAVSMPAFSRVFFSVALPMMNRISSYFSSRASRFSLLSSIRVIL